MSLYISEPSRPKQLTVALGSYDNSYMRFYINITVYLDIHSHQTHMAVSCVTSVYASCSADDLYLIPVQETKGKCLHMTESYIGVVNSGPESIHSIQLSLISCLFMISGKHIPLFMHLICSFAKLLTISSECYKCCAGVLISGS